MGFIDRLFRFGGAGEITLTDASQTLTEDQCAPFALELAGTLTANTRVITLPNIDGADWVVWNNTTGGYRLTLAAQVGSSTVVVPNGDRVHVVYTRGEGIKALGGDGAFDALPTATSVTVSGTTTLSVSELGYRALNCSGTGDAELSFTNATTPGWWVVRNATSGYIDITSPGAATIRVPRNEARVVFSTGVGTAAVYEANSANSNRQQCLYIDTAGTTTLTTRQEFAVADATTAAGAITVELPASPIDGERHTIVAYDAGHLGVTVSSTGDDIWTPGPSSGIDADVALGGSLCRALTVVYDANAPAWIVTSMTHAPRPGSREVTSTTSIRTTDQTVHADATGGALQVNLPNDDIAAGSRHTVIKVDSSANAVTVSGNGSNIAVAGVGSAATFALANQYESLTVEYLSSGLWVAI